MPAKSPWNNPRSIKKNTTPLLFLAGKYRKSTPSPRNNVVLFMYSLIFHKMHCGFSWDIPKRRKSTLFEGRVFFSYDHPNRNSTSFPRLMAGIVLNDVTSCPQKINVASKYCISLPGLYLIKIKQQYLPSPHFIIKQSW